MKEECIKKIHSSFFRKRCFDSIDNNLFTKPFNQYDSELFSNILKVARIITLIYFTLSESNDKR